MFGNGLYETNAPPDMNRYYTVRLFDPQAERRSDLTLSSLQLESADLVVPRMEAWRLLWDFRYAAPILTSTASVLCLTQSAAILPAYSRT